MALAETVNTEDFEDIKKVVKAYFSRVNPYQAIRDWSILCSLIEQKVERV